MRELFAYNNGLNFDFYGVVYAKDAPTLRPQIKYVSEGKPSTAPVNLSKYLGWYDGSLVPQEDDQNLSESKQMSPQQVQVPGPKIEEPS